MKRILRNQKGQAIFELIIFLPFLIFMLSIYYTIGNSLSGSINQQKVVRGYFYALTKNNSYINTGPDIDEFTTKHSFRLVGFSALGWREKSSDGGRKAFGPCFTFPSMLRNGTTESCDDKERGDSPSGPTSNLIRVFTFYGVCGPVYTLPQNGGRMTIEPHKQNHPALCSLDQ